MIESDKNSVGNSLLDQIIAAGQPWSGIVNKGKLLRIIDLEGDQGVDFLCYNAINTQERYHAPNTIKSAGTIRLGSGHTLYSDEARPMLTLVKDTCGYHDTIGGCCSEPSNQMLYGVSNCPGCRENFLSALAPYGMDRRDIVPNINFFCKVPVIEDGSLAKGVFEPGHSNPGNYVELRAEMDVLAIISNCPQINNPCNDGAPGPIRVLII